MRPHSSNSSENVTPIQWHIPISLLLGSTPSAHLLIALLPFAHLLVAHTQQVIYSEAYSPERTAGEIWEGQELLPWENETSLDSGPYKKYLDAPLIHMARFSSLQWVKH